MEFRIADTFTDALSRLPATDQKAVKTSAFDLQTNPEMPGLQMHRIDQSKDRHFWSVRASRDIRIIIHKTEASILLAYVDHHDRAYTWAERRRIEAHPKTGVIQIVEVRERVEELPLFAPVEPTAPPPPFARLADDQLLCIGVPFDWLADIRMATDDGFLELAQHLPPEVAEALLQYATTGGLPESGPAPADPYTHPDTLRRFRTLENVEELSNALDAPWDKWAIFLHPSQREIVTRDFTGPARIAGSAGTGKTVVALHRAVRLAKGPDACVLLATFSSPLAATLASKARLLAGPDRSVVSHLRVRALSVIAEELFELAFGRRAMIVKPELISATLEKHAQNIDSPVNMNFIRSEWTHVVDAWQVADLDAYLNVPRLGRKNRLGSKQRERLWPIFAQTRESLEARGFYTPAGIFLALAKFYAERPNKPFTHIVVDEAQDLGVPELRFLAAVAPMRGDALFFAGDIGQRIFQQPFSWNALGVDIRGRSSMLKVNYRTSHQIRRAADRLLPALLRDVDGLAEERKGTVSLFNGPEPKILIAANEAEEREAVSAFISKARADGVAASEIGIFTRTAAELSLARDAVNAAGLDSIELTEEAINNDSRVSIGTMHLAKGLEFKAVAVMACNEEVLPLQSRIEGAADELELEDVYDSERRLLYVAATRARERLFMTGVKPGSEFLRDISSRQDSNG